MCLISLRIRARTKGFRAALERVLETKAWLSESAQHSTSGVGVSGIVKKVEELQLKQATSLSSAFSDIDNLMQSAGQMAQLAEQIAARLQHEQVSAGERDEFQSILGELGMAHGLSAASRTYLQDLSEQLAQISQKLLKLRRCSLISIADVYCFYNRMRGNALCSPNEMVQAMQLWRPELVGVALVPLGRVLVVQRAEEGSSDALYAKLCSFFESCPSITAPTWSKSINLPLMLAREQLCQAESQGLVVRDSSPAGISYYPNRFLK